MVETLHLDAQYRYFRAGGCEADKVEERVESLLHANGINNHPDDSPSVKGQREQMGLSLD